MLFQWFLCKAPVKTPVNTVRFGKSLEGLQIVRDFVRTSLFIKSYPNSGFRGSRCRKLCTVGDLDAKAPIFFEFRKVQVPKVLYCGRLARKSMNIPSDLEGQVAESRVLCATWMQKYQYSLGFGRSRCRKWCTVYDLDAETSIFLRVLMFLNQNPGQNYAFPTVLKQSPGQNPGQNSQIRKIVGTVANC